jgi:hypothetical protein
MVGSVLRRVLCLSFVLAACSAGGSAGPAETELTLVPNVSTSDTLQPPSSDTLEPDNTGTLPPDAMFGGDMCTALENPDFAGMGRVRDKTPASVDSCQWTVGSGTVIVKLATPDEFARPGTTDEEIAPLDGVGIGAIGVDHGDNYQVYVQVENGFFSVTAATKAKAETLAAAAAPRATAAPAPPTTSTTVPPASTDSTDAPTSSATPSTT